MNTKLTIALIVVAVVAVAGCFLPFGGSTIADRVVGAAAGPVNYDHNFFLAGLTAGGINATTTTASAYTPVAKDFVGLPTVWKVTPNIITTFTLRQAAFLDYVPNVGDTAVIILENASTTAAGTITLAASETDLDLQKNEDVADLAIAGLDYARLTIIRKTAATTTVIYDNYVKAD